MAKGIGHKKMLIAVFISIAAAAIIYVVLTAGSICAAGFVMYRNATNQISIDDKINMIKSSKGYVKIEEVPQYFLDAVVSVEDHRFYTHRGFDIISICRAGISNILHNETLSGGSTITQQLAKNMYFTFDKLYSRKVAELIVAVQLEQKLSKEEILELYINIINFGGGHIGIQQSSTGYFGVEPHDITLEQAVLLAGIPKSPNAYSLKNPSDRIETRAMQVVDAMIENDRIPNENAQLVRKNIPIILASR